MDKKAEIRQMAQKLNVFVNKNMKIFTGKDPQTRELVKHCRDIDHLHEYLGQICKNQGVIVIPEVEITTKDFSNEDGTLAKRYSKTYEPFDHQIAYFNRAIQHKNFANFSEMGTGKTIMELMVSGYLYDRGEIEAIVIIAPNGLQFQWVNEAVPEHLIDDVNPLCGIWSSKSPRKYKNYMERFIDVEHEGLKVLAMNVEAFGSGSKKAMDYAFNFMEKHKCSLIIDESTRIKNSKASRTKSILQLSKLAEYKRILSGLYMPQGPLDLFSQFYFLNPEILGYRSFVAYKSRYTVERNPRLRADLAVALEDKKMGQKVYEARLNGYVTPYKLTGLIPDATEEQLKDCWKILKKSFLFIADYKNVSELADFIEPYSFRVLKEECLDLPEKLFTQYEVELSPEQSRLYRAMEEDLIAEVSDGVEITGEHVLKKLGHMRQVCGGTFKDENGKIHIVEGKIPRMEKMIEVIQDINPNRKIIIFACYRAEVEMIRQRLEKEGIGYAQVHGDITGQAREDQIVMFKKDPLCKIIIGTTTSFGIGRNLTEATYMFFYSNSFELESRRQGEDRLHRIGTKTNVTIIDFYNPDLIDHQIFKALMNKQEIADMVTRDQFCWRPMG
jgi:SNF2 family DNA or RNA helicase